MEMIGKVRRMKLRDKLSNSEIAKRTGLSRNTVKKWLRAPGDLAPRYQRESSDGKLTVNIGFAVNQGSLVTVQPDGKILLANFGTASSGGNNEFTLARYNADGSLDASFGGAGKVTTDFGFSSDTGYSVTLQADGKILVAGTRYNGSGDRKSVV